MLERRKWKKTGQKGPYKENEMFHAQNVLTKLSHRLPRAHNHLVAALLTKAAELGKTSGEWQDR